VSHSSSASGAIGRTIPVAAFYTTAAAPTMTTPLGTVTCYSDVGFRSF
jgi:hypothetical protein